MAGVLDLPTLIQRVRLDADTSQGEKETQSAFKRVTAGVTKVGVGLTAGLTLPIIAFGKAGIDAASDLGESMSKVGVVFDKNAGQVKAFAKTSATELGISEQAALEATGTFGNLFRALGLGTAPAADMSTSLVTLAADLASFNNANPEDVLLALRSGLLGEAEPLRAFGVSLSAARIEAEALASGLVKPTANMAEIGSASLKVEVAAKAAAKATKEHGKESIEARAANDALAKAEENLASVTKGRVPELTAAQKAQAAYAIIQKDTALAQGDFARTSDGLANQQRIMAAQFENVKASLGQALLPVMQKAVGIATGLMKAYQGLSPEGQKVAKVVLGIVAAVGPALIVIGKLAPALVGGAKAFGSMAVGIGKFVAAAPGAIASAFETGRIMLLMAKDVAVSAASSIASWVASAAAAVASAAATAAAWLVAAAPFIALGVVVAGVVLLIVKNWDTIKAATIATWNAITSAVKAAVDGVTSVVKAAFEIVKTVVTTYVKSYLLVIETAWKAIRLVVETAVAGVRAVVETVFRVIQTIIQTQINGWTAIISAGWNVIRTVFSTAVGAVTGIVSGMVNGIKAIWSGLWNTLTTLVTTGFAMIRTGLDTAVGTVLSFFSGLWGMFNQAMGGIVGKFLTLGGQIIDGLVNGIKAAPGKVRDALMGVVKNAWKSVTGFLGISSPSRLFFGIGQNTVLGFIKGFEDKKATARVKLMALFQSAVGGVNTILGSLNALEANATARSNLIAAEKELAALRAKGGDLSKEIAEQEGKVALERAKSNLFTLGEQEAILEAKIAAKAAEKEMTLAQQDGTLSQDEKTLAEIKYKLALEAVNEATAASMALSPEVEEATSRLTDLREEQKGMTDLVTAAEQALSQAKRDAIAAELALLVSGQELLGIGREGHELWRAIATQVGLTRPEIDKMAASYSALAAAINAANEAAKKTVPVVATPAKSGTTTPAKPKGLALGGTLTSSGLIEVGERGRELLDLPKGASVIPLSKARADRAMGATAPFIGGNLIGTMIVQGMSPEDVTKATSKALDRAVVNWGIGA